MFVKEKKNTERCELEGNNRRAVPLRLFLENVCILRHGVCVVRGGWKGNTRRCGRVSSSCGGGPAR